MPFVRTRLLSQRSHLFIASTVVVALPTVPQANAWGRLPSSTRPLLSMPVVPDAGGGSPTPNSFVIVASAVGWPGATEDHSRQRSSDVPAGKTHK
jgi:hypothetical protein